MGRHCRWRVQHKQRLGCNPEHKELGAALATCVRPGQLRDEGTVWGAVQMGGGPGATDDSSLELTTTATFAGQELATFGSMVGPLGEQDAQRQPRPDVGIAV